MYIHDLLVFTKGDWTDHAERLKFTLNKLKGKGLRCNIENDLLGQTQIRYLGFWVIRHSTKTINKNI